MARRLTHALVSLAAATAIACGDSTTGPTPPPIILTLPPTVEGHYSTCATCADPAAVVTFTVDVSGPGGTIESLETRVLDSSRGVEVARNTRPNGDVGLSPSALPAGGQVAIDAGIGFPPPPPRDTLTLIATARLTDGREASASANLTIVN